MIQDTRTTYIDHETDSFRELTAVPYQPQFSKIDGRDEKRKTVGDDKVYQVTASTVSDGAITTAKLANAAVNQSKLKYETVTITIASSATSGSGTCTSGSIVIGFCPMASDQIVKSISVSSTTVTVTLNAAATAQNQIQVILLKS